MLYYFFWVITRRLNSMCRRFETPCLFHLHRWCPAIYEEGIDKKFRNIGTQNSEAGKSPNNKFLTNIIFKTFCSNYYKFLNINRRRCIFFVCPHSRSSTYMYDAIKCILYYTKSCAQQLILEILFVNIKGSLIRAVVFNVKILSSGLKGSDKNVEALVVG